MSKFLIIIFIVSIIISCKTKEVIISNRNINNIYNPSKKFINPEVNIYNLNDSVSEVSIKIDPKELYKIKNSFEKYELLIKHKVLDNFSSNNIIDSSSILLKIDTNLTETFITKFNIKSPILKKYVLEINYSTQTPHKETFSIIEFDKSKLGNKEDYLLKSKKYGNLFFENWFKVGTEINLSSSRINNKPLTLKYYKKIHEASPPPYSLIKLKSNNYNPDSSWTIDFSKTNTLELNKEGIYQISLDSLNNGFSLYAYNYIFPIVDSPDKMLGPLRYLTSNKEFRELEANNNQKKSVDDTWLKFAGNPSRAKELIRIYYGRVIFANIYFHSYKEGWMSDRGMIYVIFGPPSTIFKTDSYEKWLYSDTRNPNSLSFTFMKIENKLSSNDFELIRSENYKGIWHQALDTWRNGRVYSVIK